MYLVYNPKDLKQNIDKSYCKRIMKRHEDVVEFIKTNISLFNEIFQAILQYQVDTHKLEKPEIDFDFKLVDQYNYKLE